MAFSRQEHWSGLPFPSPGELPNPGIETRSSTPPGLFSWRPCYQEVPGLETKHGEGKLTVILLPDSASAAHP